MKKSMGKYAGSNNAKGKVVARQTPEVFFIRIANSSTDSENFDVFNAFGSISPTETTNGADGDISTSEGGTIAQFRNRIAQQNIAVSGIHYEVGNEADYNLPFVYYSRDVDGSQKSKSLAALIQRSKTARREIATILELPFRFMITGDMTLVLGVGGSRTSTLTFDVVPGGITRNV